MQLIDLKKWFYSSRQWRPSSTSFPSLHWKVNNGMNYFMLINDVIYVLIFFRWKAGKGGWRRQHSAFERFQQGVMDFCFLFAIVLMLQTIMFSSVFCFGSLYGSIHRHMLLHEVISFNFNCIIKIKTNQNLTSIRKGKPEPRLLHS